MGRYKRYLKREVKKYFKYSILISLLGIVIQSAQSNQLVLQDFFIKHYIQFFQTIYYSIGSSIFIGGGLLVVVLLTQFYYILLTYFLCRFIISLIKYLDLGGL